MVRFRQGIPGSTNSGTFQYTGQMWLPELGMQYSKARIYSPTLGRFLQTDPIGYGDGMNMYAYVGGDPVNFVDPLGLQAIRVCRTEYRLAGATVEQDGYPPGPSRGPSYVGYEVCEWIDVPDGPTVMTPGSTGGITFSGGGGLQNGQMLAAQKKGERGKAAKPTGTKNPDKKYKPGPRPGSRIFTDPHDGKKTIKPWPDDPRLGGSSFTAGDALKGAAVVVVVGGVAILLAPEIAAALAAAGVVTVLAN